MNRIVGILIALACCGQTLAQENSHTVTLEVYRLLGSTRYSVSDVIDMRRDTLSIGSVYKGSDDRPTLAKFPKGLENYLQDVFPIYFPDDSLSEALIVLVHQFGISEVIFPLLEAAICRVELQFIKPSNGQFQSMGIYRVSHRDITDGDITNRHPDLIRDSFQDIFSELSKSNSRPKERVPSIESYRGAKVSSSSPKPGLYLSHVEMARKEPIDTVIFHLRKRESYSKYEEYDMYTETAFDIDDILYASKEGKVYVNSKGLGLGSRFIELKA